MDPGRESRLDRLASTLRSASEKLDAGLPLAEEEVRRLRALGTAAPGDPRYRAPLPVIAAAAAVLLVSGFFAVFYLAGPDQGDGAAVEIAMAPSGGTRAAAGWREGDLFTLEVTLPGELHLHLVHLDAGGKLELVFPFHDAATGDWSYLGYASNRLPGGTPVAIPAPGFPMDLRIEGGAPGEELFLAFAARERIGEEELLVLRDELRAVVEEARRANEGGDAVVGRLRAALAGRAGASFGLLRYEVERS